MTPRIRAALLLALVFVVAAPRFRAASPDIVISQIYGGGGNAGATYTNDFIELYNRGSAAVDVTGWTVQYASAAAGTWQTTQLSGTIQPGQYFLVQEAVGAGGTTALPTPDAVGTISMGATAGKVAVARDASALSGTCPTGGAIADFVGFGTTANCAEGSAAPAPDNTTAVLRLQGGAVDTDSNSADFVKGAATPRNSGSATVALSATGSATPPAIQPGSATLLTVAVTPGTNPASTNLSVAADLSAIFGSPGTVQALLDNGTGGDVTPGDNVFSLAVTPTAEPGSFALPVTVSDAQGRSATATIPLAISAPAADVVISQVYGGGGNTGAIYRNDFIELRNREAFDVNVAGWSVQYASSAGTTWATTPLSGVIPAGGYYLVQEAAGAGGTLALPAPDATGTIAMSAASGKIALVATLAPLSGGCPAAGLLDFVGYGAATCFEGSAAAPALSNTTAAARLGLGSTDTNDNRADFVADAPAPRTTLGIPPVGVGAASPASLASGGNTLLTVTVTPGAFPASDITSVSVDLSPIGGAAQPFFDDGTHGDLTAGDRVYSYTTVVAGSPGFKVLTGTIGDARGRSSSPTIRLAVEAASTSTIAQIQGAGSISPLAGQFVTTTGIVTAVRSTGYFIQTPDGSGDGNPLSSEGVFVFTSGSPIKPSVGDALVVSGVVSEFGPAPPSPPTTEIGGGPVFARVESGLPLPAPVVLTSADTSPGGGVEQLERYEGMRVRGALVVVAPTDGTVIESSATSMSNGVFYGVLKGLARPVREPGLDPASAVPPNLPCCVPTFDGNPERIRVDSSAQTGAPLLDVAAGQEIADVTGVLDFAFGSYTILPDPGAAIVTGLQAATPVPAPGPNEFTIGSFNLERFFDEADDPLHDDAVLTPEAVNSRLQKASLAIRHVLLAPDILGVVEVENLGILQRLATRINADAVTETGVDPTYTAYLEEGNDIGGIDSGFLVKSSRVDVLGVQQLGKDTTYTPPGQADAALLNDRPPLVLKAAVHGPSPTPLPITVIVNHLRSLSGIDGTDGARIRAKRRAQAEYLATLIQSYQATEAVVSVGDYNAYQFSDGFVDVVGTIKGQPAPADQVALASPDLVDPNLTSLGDTLGPSQQYSFVFDGNAQALDHVLVDELALNRFSRVAYGRVDADFPESLRSDATRPERISDHDPVLAYFVFPTAPVVTLVGASTLDVEAYTSFTDPGATAHDEEGALTVTVTGSVDVNVPGNYTLTYSATNGFFTTDVTRTVRVLDSVAPTIGSFRVTPDRLSPADHRLVDVLLDYAVTDASGTASCSAAVSSTELPNQPGDGNTPIDWIVVDATHVQLRAERAGGGRGRTYTVSLSCSDHAGNVAHQDRSVFVPR